MSAYSLEITHDVGNPEWLAFVNGVANGNIRQDPAWARAKMATGYGGQLLLVRHGEKLVGGALLLIKNYAFGFKIGIVSQGPCLMDEEPDLVHFLSQSLKAFCRQSSLLYIIVELPYFKGAWLPQFNQNGFVPMPKGLPGGFFFNTTWMLDLTPELGIIFSGFSAARRRYVRKSAQLPIVFRQGEAEDLDTCYDLFLHTANRRNGFFVEPHKAFYHELLKVPQANRQVLLLIGEVDGKIVSASFCLLSGDVFMHYIWGWTGEYADQHYSDAVYWYMIQLAKEKGFRFFDFVQVDDAVASAVLSGSPLDNSVRSRSFFGPTFYKMSFGGQTVSTPGILCYFPSKVHFWLANKLLAALNCSRLMQRPLKFIYGGLVKSLR